MQKSNRIVFFNIACMKEYKGVTSNDRPVHGGSYVQQHGLGGEVFNFHRFQGRLYGFVEAGTGYSPRSIRIERLGAPPNAISISDILVIWVARQSYCQKTLVVGWYEHAKVYSDRQTPPPNMPRKDPSGGYAPYCVEAEADNCLLIPPDKRCFRIFRAAELAKEPIDPHQPPKHAGGIGQSNVYYGQDWYGDHIRPQILEYVAKWNKQKHLSVPM